TDEAEGSFTPDRAGVYTLAVDVQAEDGTKVTAQTEVVVSDPFELTAVSAPSAALVGEEVPFAADARGDLDGARYNYVWSRNGSWAAGEWGSTVQSTGSMT
ncbi:hypothetical protein, partial [Collinsella intestinalis]|uniref:hypothetical protein n=1 Tax=Collinsella intestinalis TaxID=147207 RepID=UPI0019560588